MADLTASNVFENAAVNVGLWNQRADMENLEGGGDVGRQAGGSAASGAFENAAVDTILCLCERQV